MSGNPSDKDNANPTILAVDRTSAQTRKRRQALEYPELAALSAPPEREEKEQQDNGVFSDSSSFWGSQQQKQQQRTAVFAQDRRIMLQALTDAAEASKGSTVSLLRQHLIIPDNADVLQLALKREPLFVPHPESTVVKDTRDETSAAKTTTSQQAQPDPVTPDEIFEIIRDIQDPEHPLTLEQLSVVSREQITIRDRTVSVRFTPTVPHCSMATLIGLTLSVKLWRSVQPVYKVLVSIEPGSHASETAINKQLADKERVCAALENQHLLGVVNKCIANGMNQHSLE